MPSSIQHSLFESTGSPLPEFDRAFESWVAASRTAKRMRRDSTEAVYRDIWGALTEWCCSQAPPVHVDDISADDLRVFVASRSEATPNDELSHRYVWRVLKLIDRVLAHRAAERDEPSNTAALMLLESRGDWRYANAAEADPPLEYLDASEGKRLVTFLSQIRRRAGGVLVSVRTWQELRDRTAVALQLGAGLTPGEIRSLKLDAAVTAGGQSKEVPWKIKVPGNGNAPGREAPIAGWAGQLLRYWLEMRKEYAIPGDWMFTSTRTGKPWGKVAQYEAAKRVLVDAGIDAVGGGSFRLRHTFALRQLRRGKSIEDVARYLGIVDLSLMERYRRVLTAPVDLV